MIETERLILRPVEADDVDDVLAIYGDPETARFAIGGVRDRAACEEWVRLVIEKRRARGQGFLAAILKETGAYTGHAGLLWQDVDGTEELEIGYWSNRSYWGRGLATEAATALREYAFGTLDRSRVISIIDVNNTASQRVAQRNGMTVEKHTRWKGIDVAIYAVERNG